MNADDAADSDDIVIETMERVAAVDGEVSAGEGVSAEEEVSAEETREPDHLQVFRDRLHGTSLHSEVAAAGPTGRFRRLKAKLSSGAHPSLAQQARFNRELVATLGAAEEHITRLQARIDALEDNSTRTWHAVHEAATSSIDEALRATIATHDILIEELAETQQGVVEDVGRMRDHVEANAKGLAQREAEIADLVRPLEAAETAVGRLESDLGEARARLDMTLRAVREGDDDPVTRTLEQVSELRASEFYAAFEERFRGSRAKVIERLKAYEPDIASLCKHGPVLDIGPGRGEWLSLLAEHGAAAYGVDTNDTFVEQGAALGLDIRHEDALVHLAELPPASLGAVTAFHVAEHLGIELLLELLDRAFVALKPGGMLLLETPNPTNLTVGAASFYLDPTHLRPLHSHLLSFAVEHAGFVDVEVRFLHPSGPSAPAGADEDALTAEMRWALHGPQDLAVLAVRPGG